MVNESLLFVVKQYNIILYLLDELLWKHKLSYILT